MREAFGGILRLLHHELGLGLRRPADVVRRALRREERVLQDPFALPVFGVLVLQAPDAPLEARVLACQSLHLFRRHVEKRSDLRRVEAFPLARKAVLLNFEGRQSCRLVRTP